LAPSTIRFPNLRSPRPSVAPIAPAGGQIVPTSDQAINARPDVIWQTPPA